MSGVLRKTYPVTVKAIGDAEEGKVEAIVSVFGNVDLGGDRVVKGAFAKSIDKWKASGFPVPVIFSHSWGDLWSHIGAVDSLEETEQGLKAIYTLDVGDNPAAAQVYRLMKRGTLKEHSFAYSIPDGGERKAKDGANELLELDIIEVGPTLKGMNPETEMLAVKSALEQVTAEHEKSASPGVDAKAGRSLSKANEAKLRAAMESISQVLSSLGSPDEETEKSEDEDKAGKSAEVDEADKSSDLEFLSINQAIDKMKEWNNAVR